MKKLLLAVCIGSLFGCQSNVFKDDLPKILGVSNVEIQDSQGTDEFGGFGEGYTLEVYELSEKTVKAFINLTAKNLPDKKEEGKNWEKHDWSKTPIDTSYNGVLSLVLNYRSSTKLENQLNDIKKLLEKPDVYYSFYYYSNEEVKEYIEDAQFFILDVQSRKLYTIESNI